MFYQDKNNRGNVKSLLYILVMNCKLMAPLPSCVLNCLCFKGIVEVLDLNLTHTHAAIQNIIIIQTLIIIIIIIIIIF